MIKNKWEKMKWGQLATLEYGKSVRDYDDLVSEQKPYRVFGTNGPIGWYSSYLCDRPGIIVGRKGAYRGIHFSSTPFFVIDTAFYLKPKSEFDIRWAYYQLKNYDINKIDSGSAIPSTSREAFYVIPVQVPPIEKQRQIASILSAYDGLIENNTRRIKILEEMARLIYREWFVEYKAPGIKLRKATPEEMKVTSKDVFPEEWEIKELGEFITLDKGLSYKGEGLTVDGIPMVNLKNILVGGGFRRDGTKPYSGEYRSNHLVQAKDIIIANTDLTQAGNVVGSPAFIPKGVFKNEVIITHHLFAVRRIHPEMFPIHYLYHVLLQNEFKSFAKSYASGTTVLGLPREGVLRYKWAIPSQRLRNEYEEQVSHLYSQMDLLNNQIDNLRQTRDLLLPKLISGEVEV